MNRKTRLFRRLIFAVTITTLLTYTVVANAEENVGEKIYSDASELNGLVSVSIDRYLMQEHILNLKVESSDPTIIDEGGNALKGGTV